MFGRFLQMDCIFIIMRPLWTGAIGFGLVNIPVKLYSATASSSLDLDMLDKKDFSRIRFVRINEKTGKEVNWENIVKGYMLDDEYVVLTKKDFEAASVKKSKIIEVDTFVKEEEIESIYYETPYYLKPEPSGEKAYSLLREALHETKKVGLGTFVMRSKENLAVLKPFSDYMMLYRLRFEQEIRDPEELGFSSKNDVKPKELKMAVALISQHSEKFNIARYKDTYTTQLLKFIKAKAKGKGKVTASELKVVYSKPKDLMEQLRVSLEKSKRAS